MPKPPKLPRALNIYLLLSLFFSGGAMADNTKETVTAEVELARLERALAVASRERLLAELPQGTAKGLSGEVTLKEGAGYYAEVLAYQALAEAAEGVAEAVREVVRGRSVVLTDRPDLLAHDGLWRLLEGKLSDFEAQVADVLREYRKPDGRPNFEVLQSAAVAGALPGVLGAASEVAAFFRVNRELTGRSVKLASSAALAEVAARLPEAAGIWLPGLPGRATDDSLVERLRRLLDSRRELLALREAFESRYASDPSYRAALDQQLATLTAERDRLRSAGDSAALAEVEKRREAVVDERTPLVADHERFERIKKRFDPLTTEIVAFAEALTTRSAGAAAAPLEIVSDVDALRAHGPETLLLYLAIVSQGAEVHVTKTAWTSGHIAYVGGCVLQFLLLDPTTGRLLASGLVPAHRAESFKARRGSAIAAAQEKP